MLTFGPTASRAGFHQEVTPLGPSRKRKDRDAPPSPSAPAPASSSRPALAKSKPNPSGDDVSCNTGSNNGGNMVLAGYLAHEFLTRGTVLGERPDPTAAARWKEESAGNEKTAAAACGDVTGRLVMGEGGARVLGIVNPTQLAHWLQTKP